MTSRESGWRRRRVRVVVTGGRQRNRHLRHHHCSAPEGAASKGEGERYPTRHPTRSSRQPNGFLGQRIRWTLPHQRPRLPPPPPPPSICTRSPILRLLYGDTSRILPEPLMHRPRFLSVRFPPILPPPPRHVPNAGTILHDHTRSTTFTVGITKAHIVPVVEQNRRSKRHTRRGTPRYVIPPWYRSHPPPLPSFPNARPS